jgi:5'-3' exoribonuclease 1
MRLDDGSFVKDFEGPNAEAEHAVQMTLKESHYEDPRFMERPAPPLSEEFPEGSNLFFLGEHAYGVAAKVSAASQDTLAIMIAVRVH